MSGAKTSGDKEQSTSVLAFNRCRRAPLALVLTSTLAFAALSLPAQAQGKLEAKYTVSLAGIPIGTGEWTIGVADTHYTASASGTTTGLMRVLTGGHGTTTANGTLGPGRPISSVYASTVFAHKKSDSISFTVSNGTVKDLKLDPPQDPDPERVPIVEGHEQGVVDPITATLIRVPGDGDLVSSSACQHTLSVFDGRMRYELQLAFKRIDQVKTDKGYAGPVVVCAVYFTPVAGYVPSRTAIRYIAKLRDIELWLAPIAGTRVLAPYRAQGPSPIGLVVFQAVEFVSLPAPAKASANGSKSQ